jgi:hypothetical protein
MPIIQLIFLLIALLMVISALFPAWNFAAGPSVAVNRLIGLLIGLVVLYIVYLIVVALFGGGPVRLLP